jgi:hypothetical protein
VHKLRGDFRTAITAASRPSASDPRTGRRHGPNI